MRCMQCPTFKNCWTVVAEDANEEEEVIGFFMVYLDDIIMFAETPVLRKVVGAVQSNGHAR
eukprot:8082900-Prorocentrum_lima.AAC.1